MELTDIARARDLPTANVHATVIPQSDDIVTTHLESVGDHGTTHQNVSLSGHVSTASIAVNGRDLAHVDVSREKDISTGPPNVVSVHTSVSIHELSSEVPYSLESLVTSDSDDRLTATASFQGVPGKLDPIEPEGGRSSNVAATSLLQEVPSALGNRGSGDESSTNVSPTLRIA